MCRFPISVLDYNITSEFEKILSRNKIDIHKAIEDRKINSVIDLILDHIAPRGPHANHETRQIVLYESHLAYLWAYFYGSFVLYEECIQKPMVEGKFDGAIHFCNTLQTRAANLQDWVILLSKNYMPWDEEKLPNPKSPADSSEQWYCEKVNALFLKAVTFLMLHEYAHLVLGHKPSKNDNAWSIEQEKDADNYAFSNMVDSYASEKERKIAGLSLVLLYASNFFLPKDFRGIWQPRHPNLHDRLRNGITHLNLQSEESKFYLYYLASISLQQYLQSQSISFGRLEQETAEDLFFEYLDKIDDLQ